MFEPISALFSAISTFFCMIFAVWLASKWTTRNIRDEATNILTTLVTPEKEGQVSPLESYLAKIGEGFAVSMRNSMAAQVGGDLRTARAVDKAIGLDMMDNTGIGGILDILGMGNVKGLLAKNPATLGLILQRVAPLISNYAQGQKIVGSKSTVYGNPFEVK